MKKRFLLISLFIALLHVAGRTQCFYQIGLDDYETIGESRHVITYDVRFVNNPLEPIEESKDRIILEIGDRRSRCYNWKLYENDSVTGSIIARGGEAGPTLEAGPFNADVYKDRKSGEVTVVQRTPIRGPILQYTDFGTKASDWVIHDETKQILGYTCKKALCAFRGRTWTAWYALEIPIQDGPWKLCGLPGLILQAEDNKGHFSFVCTSIRNEKRPIKMLDKMYCQKSTRDDAVQAIRLYHGDLYGYLAMLQPDMPVQAMTAKGKKVDMKDSEKYKIPFNPIELE